MSAAWEMDGVGCGGHYLDTKIDGLRAGVHDYGSFVECHIWTPGCGFSPIKTIHPDIVSAKSHAEMQLSAMRGEA